MHLFVSRTSSPSQPMESHVRDTHPRLTDEKQVEPRINRVPIDTSTYRVAKRKSAEKITPPNQKENVQNTEKSKSTFSNSQPLKEFSPSTEFFQSKLMAPPPSPPPLDVEAEKLLEEIVNRRKSGNVLLPAQR